jgi:serine/threonine protein phosphatase 1
MNRLFAISDIHGCYKPFYELVVNTIKLTKSDRLMLLGDYIDRGEQSKDVIDFIIDLKKTGFNVFPLAGNHEVMLLDSFNNSEIIPLWLMNSGMSTLNSFGIQNIKEIDNKYLDFFKSLEFCRILDKVIFVHAGLDDFAIDPFADRRGMVWECRTSYQHPLLSDKVIIHGHRPKTLSFIEGLINGKSKVIPIDTGCVYKTAMGYGILSALEVDSMKMYSVQNE